VNVRKATENDMDGICLLSNEINADHYMNLPGDFSEPDGSNRDEPYWRGFISAEKSTVFVAVHDDILVGVVALKVTDSAPFPFIKSRLVGHLATIVVGRKYQGKGIGRSLMQAAEAFAAEMGAEDIKLEVMAFNSNALSFYKELGYGNFSYLLSKSLP
jgi:ribosomal protein S18 acetylase RimI-like enzyme